MPQSVVYSPMKTERPCGRVLRASVWMKTSGKKKSFQVGTAFWIAAITIGDDCLLGPNVQLLTPTHPVAIEPRRDKLEAALPITLGRNVWLGGGVIVCPGVTIGDNSVVGAGSVVTRDIPANVVAVGNPARVIREISDADDR